MSNYVQTAMRNTYQLTCSDSHSDDFESNVEEFEYTDSQWRGLRGFVNTFMMPVVSEVLGTRSPVELRAHIIRISEISGIQMAEPSSGTAGLTDWVNAQVEYMANAYRDWLGQGNCPPPRSPSLGSESQAIVTSKDKSTGSETKGSDSSGEPKNSVKEFLAENWKGFALAGGLLAATCALWGISAFLVADDITGVGTIDDPALAVTVPAASAATTATVATVTALAASALLYFGMGATDPSRLS